MIFFFILKKKIHSKRGQQLRWNKYFFKQFLRGTTNILVLVVSTKLKKKLTDECYEEYVSHFVFYFSVFSGHKTETKIRSNIRKIKHIHSDKITCWSGSCLQNFGQKVSLRRPPLKWFLRLWHYLATSSRLETPLHTWIKSIQSYPKFVPKSKIFRQSCATWKSRSWRVPRSLHVLGKITMSW